MLNLISNAVIKRDWLRSVKARILESQKNDAAINGTLIIKQHKGRTDYYHRLPDDVGSRNKMVYIPDENITFARALAQKDYNARVLRFADSSLRAIEKLLATLPARTLQSIYEELDPERQRLVIPILMTDEQYIEWWLSKPYMGKGFRPGETGLRTDRGELVRSKSEVIIANILYSAGIPYKYECPVNIKGTVYYPDFTILDIRTRREIYLEHFGMMDDPEYAVKFLQKLEVYEHNGIIPGRNLICTFESSKIMLDIPLVKLLLNEYLGLKL